MCRNKAAECRKQKALSKAKLNWKARYLAVRRPELAEAKAAKYKRNPVDCKQCGRQFRPQFGSTLRVFCSSRCRTKYSRKTGNQTRRARQSGSNGPFENFNPITIFKRDGWICGICKEPVDPKLRYPNPRSASLDHKIPLAKGGPHTRANAQCAHLECNVKKGDETVRNQWKRTSAAVRNGSSPVRTAGNPSA